MPSKPNKLNEVAKRFYKNDQPTETRAAKVDEDNDLDTEFLKSGRVQFISAVDSKAVKPSYLRLMDF
jgi:hypothetical protein